MVKYGLDLFGGILYVDMTSRVVVSKEFDVRYPEVNVSYEIKTKKLPYYNSSLVNKVQFVDERF